MKRKLNSSQCRCCPQTRNSTGMQAATQRMLRLSPISQRAISISSAQLPRAKSTSSTYTPAVPSTILCGIAIIRKNRGPLFSVIST